MTNKNSLFFSFLIEFDPNTRNYSFVSKSRLLFCRQTHLFRELWDDLKDLVRYLRLVAVSGEPFPTVIDNVLSVKSSGFLISIRIIGFITASRSACLILGMQLFLQ